MYRINGNIFKTVTKQEAIEDIETYYDKDKKVGKQNKEFETLKQKALDKKAELEKNYGKIEEEVKQTLEIEMNYFTPLVHHLIQKHINQYGKDFPMYFSGYNITKLTQGNDRTALIYAGKDEIDIVDKQDFFINGKGFRKFNDGSIIITDAIIDSNGKILGRQNSVKGTQQEYEKAYQQATELKAKEIKYKAAQQIGIIPLVSYGESVSLEEGIKKLNEYKRQSKQNMDRVINTIMNISNNKPIETGAIYNAMSQVSGIKLIWQNSIPGLKGNPVNKTDRTIRSSDGAFIVRRGGYEQPGTYNTIEEAEAFIATHSINFKYNRNEYEIIDIKEEIPGGTGGYLVDLSNYNYNTPILYGLDTSKVSSKSNSIKPGVKELFQETPELASIDRHASSYFTKNNAFFIDHVTSEAMFDNIKSYLSFHYPGIKTYDDYRNYIFELNDKDTILNFINFVTKC